HRVAAACTEAAAVRAEDRWEQIPMTIEHRRATTGDTVDTEEKSCFRKRLPLCVRRVLRGGAVIVTLVALAVGARLGAQEQVFKAGIRTVAVYATVANVDGRLVPDLGRDKFSILDNGKTAEPTPFANDAQP